MNFSKRIYDKELLDGDNIPYNDILQNMKELNTINHLLGGHSITILGLKKILAQTKPQSSIIHIVEIGSGGGDNVRVLQSYCNKNSITAKFTGIDINPHCIAFARTRDQQSLVDYIHSDYKDVSFHEKPDIIFSSLFCHHFMESELVHIFKWKYENSKLGFFVNDLQRHPLAFYSIKVLTRLFSNSFLVRNDAPLSVRRGFSKNELIELLQSAGVLNSRVSWQWAFRFLLIATHHTKSDDKL